MLITTLRARYERIDGIDDASDLRRLNFKKRWRTTPMATKIGVDIRWQYVVPRWLFPPPIRLDDRGTTNMEKKHVGYLV